MGIQEGNTVKIHYNAKVDDKVIDTSRNAEPMEFKVGEGQVVPGLEEGVVGLEEGDKETVVVPPEKAYGERKEGLTRELPRETFKDSSQQIEEGMVLRYRTERGEAGLATIEKVEEENITLDLNHPLAGQTIKFEVEVVDVK